MQLLKLIINPKIICEFTMLLFSCFHILFLQVTKWYYQKENTAFHSVLCYLQNFHLLLKESLVIFDTRSRLWLIDHGNLTMR